jgi:coenzyme F420-0:L-glutamate ligase / coenzyme F420-1:gamma-L-glutamate ligase
VAQLRASALRGLPEVSAGDDLAGLIVEALQASSRRLRAGELVAIAQKVVSKAEGAVVALADVTPSPRAIELAAAPPGGQAKDPRAVQVVLEQSTELLRAERGVLVCRTHHGFVCANAGVDASNAAPETVIVLPEDPDRSARRIRARLRELSGWRERDGTMPAVLISDSFGRAWRHGQLDVAIGLAGMQPLDDWRGRSDASGRKLHATWLAVADAAAACAELARAKDSREPVVLIDGLERYITAENGPGAVALLRTREEDLFP